MSEIAIRLEGLGKEYRIGEEQSRHDTLGEQLKSTLKGPFRRAWKLLRGEAYGAAELDETIWALRDISFEVEKGEVVGIIGANGAGKSTLLKILSRITEPTEGHAEVRGRTGSLLEVGTGFHQELTGRENIFLNGAVLGMTKAEIEEKFDEIVDFAGTRKFLDTPIKHYSSGMKVRLAFAVAAHLDPEVLLIDEVLSVGDAAFRKKCLGKMAEVAGAGRTVLFVSHNMATVSNLCERVLLLRDGRIVRDGPAHDVVSEYLRTGAEQSGIWTRSEEGGDGEGSAVLINAVRVLSSQGKPSPSVAFGQDFTIEIAYEVVESVRNSTIGCRLTNERGTHVWTSWDIDTTDWGGRSRPPGKYVSRCRVPARTLRPGQFYVSVGAHVPEVAILESLPDVLAFEVSSMGYPLNPGRVGVVTPLLEWDVQRSVADRSQAVGEEVS